MRSLVAALIVLALASYTASLAQAQEAGRTVALLYDAGGKFDKGFNQSAYEGMIRARQAFGLRVLEYESRDMENSTVQFQQATEASDYILAIGFSMKDPVERFAARFPDKKFYLLDAVARQPNVESIIFREEEGAFLVGAAAALSTKSGKIGFIGGRDVAVIQRFLQGYEQGAREINPDIDVEHVFLGDTVDIWREPFPAYLAARKMIKGGVDVVFAAAGGSGFGVYQAAHDFGALAIGVDANQNFLHPGVMLTSMLKRVDEAVYQALERIAQDRWQGGMIHMGLAEQGVGYSIDDFNKELLSAATLERLDQLETSLVAGQIKITLDQGTQ